MGGYTKLFQDIVTSTIWVECNDCRVLWITILALKDETNVCRATVPALAKMCNITIQECEDYLVKFQEPDEYSRSREFEGRRIERVDGGWLVLNGQKYRDMMRGEERRDYVREQVRKHRQRAKQNTIDYSNQSNQCKPIAEAEAQAEEDLIVCGVPHTRHSRSASPPDPAPDSPKTPKIPKIPDCPYSAIVDLYHERLPTLPRIVALNDIRKRHLKARWRDDPDLDSWRQFFDYVGTSKFLMGRAAPQPNRPPFVADIDFLMNDSNQLKIAEGKFHRG